MTTAAQVYSKETTQSSKRSAVVGAVRVDCAGIRWLVRTDAEEAMFGPDAPRWSELGQEPRASCVKAGFRRMTWRITLADRTVYAKVFHGHGLLDHVKSRCALTAVHREWRAACKADSLGIPVAKPLAVGVRRGGPPVAIYVCDAVEAAQTLAEAWAHIAADHPTGHDYRPLIAAVAKLYAVAHHHGMYHPDGHPNNILVHKDPAATIGAVYIDLPWAQIRGRPLGTSATAASMAQLDHYFRRLAPTTDRIRFVHAYYAARHAFETDRALTDRIRFLLAAIEEARQKHRTRLAARRDRRLCGKTAYFQRLRFGGGWRGLFAMRLARRHVFDLADQPDRTAADWHQIVGALTEPLGEISTPGAPYPGVHGARIETSRPTGVLRRIIWTLRGSPDLHSFLEAHQRRHRDKPAPLVLGYAERRRGGLVDLTATFHPDTETAEERPNADFAAGRHHGSD